MKKQVLDADPRLRVDVTFGCSSIEDAAAVITVLRASGHGRGLTLVRLRASPAAGFAARTIRSGHADASDARPDDVAYAMRAVSASEAARLFAAARLLLAAQVHAELPPATGERIYAPMVLGNSNAPSTTVRLEDAHGKVAEAVFLGVTAELAGASERLRLEALWQLLAPLAVGPFVSDPPTPDDRALFVDAWLAVNSPPPWLNDRLLELAANLGTPRVLSRAVLALDSARTETRRRAVDAIAAITGSDHRRDGSGSLRPLAEVVAEDKRECSPAPSP